MRTKSTARGTITDMRVRVLATLAVVLGCLLGIVLSYELPAQASRNTAGSYSLPSGNPVVSGTTISSTWANTTLADLGTELTNSLDRQGRGAMLAPLPLSSGTVTTPGLTFSSEPGSGLYRAGSNDLRMSVNQSAVEKWTSGAVTMLGTLTVNGATTLSSGAVVSGALSVSGASTLTGGVTGALSATGNLVADSGGANSGSITNSLVLGGGGEGIGSRRTAGTNQNGLDLYTASTARLSITSGGLVQIPGAYAANPGTGVSGSYGATYSITEGTVTSGICGTSAQALNGVSSGGVCSVSADAELGGVTHAVVWTDCFVGSANFVTIRFCNASGSNFNFGTGNYRVRVWQP